MHAFYVQNTLPSVAVWQISWDEEEFVLITSIGVLDVSSEPELEEEDEELVEFVEQDLEDSEDSEATQFKLSFFLRTLFGFIFSLLIALLFPESES